MIITPELIAARRAELLGELADLDAVERVFERMAAAQPVVEIAADYSADYSFLDEIPPTDAPPAVAQTDAAFVSRGSSEAEPEAVESSASIPEYVSDVTPEAVAAVRARAADALADADLELVDGIEIADVREDPAIAEPGGPNHEVSAPISQTGKSVEPSGSAAPSARQRAMDGLKQRIAVLNQEHPEFTSIQAAEYLGCSRGAVRGVSSMIGIKWVEAKKGRPKKASSEPVESRDLVPAPEHPPSEEPAPPPAYEPVAHDPTDVVLPNGPKGPIEAEMIASTIERRKRLGMVA